MNESEMDKPLGRIITYANVCRFFMIVLVSICDRDASKQLWRHVYARAQCTLSSLDDEQIRDYY